MVEQAAETQATVEVETFSSGGEVPNDPLKQTEDPAKFRDSDQA